MTSFVLPHQAAPHGSYVVAGVARTDAIGDILRASFVPGKDAMETGGDDLGRLLSLLDRPSHSF